MAQQYSILALDFLTDFGVCVAVSTVGTPTGTALAALQRIACKPPCSGGCTGSRCFFFTFLEASHAPLHKRRLHVFLSSPFLHTS